MGDTQLFDSRGFFLRRVKVVISSYEWLFGFSMLKPSTVATPRRAKSAHTKIGSGAWFAKDVSLDDG